MHIDTAYEISFNSLTANLFHSFVRKNVFYSKNVQYSYNFYGTDLNVCRDVFRIQSNIYARLGSRYVSVIGFTVEKVYRSHYLSDIVKIDFKNLPLRSCLSN